MPYLLAFRCTHFTLLELIFPLHNYPSLIFQCPYLYCHNIVLVDSKVLMDFFLESFHETIMGLGHIDW